METLEVLKEKINHIEEDLISLKNTIMKMDINDSKKSEVSWKDLLSASREISKKWKGASAVEEIKTSVPESV